MTDTAWIVTSQENTQDCWGHHHFEGAYKDEPTFQQLKELLPYETDVMIGKLTRGGGRQKYENTWYILREIKLL